MACAKTRLRQKETLNQTVFIPEMSIIRHRGGCYFLHTGPHDFVQTKSTKCRALKTISRLYYLTLYIWHFSNVILAISRMETWHISESRCCVSPISFRAARILIPNLPKSSTGIIVHLNNILSCRLRLWNDLIILVNKHDCSGCAPDLIGESLLNK